MWIRTSLFPDEVLGPTVEPTQEDVEFLIESADTDGDGVLDRDEVLPILGTWQHLVTEVCICMCVPSSCSETNRMGTNMIARSCSPSIINNLAH